MKLTEPMKIALTNAVKLAYQRRLTPTLADVRELLGRVNSPRETVGALERRLSRLSQGNLGRLFCAETSFDPQKCSLHP